MNRDILEKLKTLWTERYIDSEDVGYFGSCSRLQWCLSVVEFLNTYEKAVGGDFALVAQEVLDEQG